MLVNSGRLQLAQIAAGLSPAEALDFRLFINFPTITATTVLADLTEASWAGYAPFSVSLGAWQAPILDSSNNAVAIANPLAGFSNTSGFPQAATGFFCTGHVSGVLYAAELFNPGFLLQTGQTATLDPVLEVNTL